MPCGKSKHWGLFQWKTTSTFPVVCFVGSLLFWAREAINWLCGYVVVVENEPMNFSKGTKIYSGVLFHVFQSFLTNRTTSCSLRRYLTHRTISSTTTTLHSWHGLLTALCIEKEMAWTTQYTIKHVLDPPFESEPKPQVINCVLCVS